MKLLCVIPSYWPAFQYGGPIASVHALNKAMAREGILISVFTTNVGLDGQVTVNAETDVEGVPVTYFSFNPYLEIFGGTGLQFSWLITESLKKNLPLFDAAYIVSVWNYPSMMAAYYCRKYRKPYVLSPRGLLYPETFNKKSWKKWPYYYLAAKRALQEAAAIHYTTEDEAEKTHAYLGLENRALVIPNGIDLSEFRDIPKNAELEKRYPSLAGKKVILFLGRISWKKGLDILVRAYARLLEERDDLHLLIVGQDQEGFGAKVKSWLEHYGIKYVEADRGCPADLSRAAAAKVTFTGMLVGREKLEAYAGSDLFVLPSYSENFGMTILEAMACGTPLVISNCVGIWREVEKNRAGLVVETDAESLREGIGRLLDHPELRQKSIENGKQMLTDYQSERVAQKMIRELESLAASAI